MFPIRAERCAAVPGLANSCMTFASSASGLASSDQAFPTSGSTASCIDLHARMHGPAYIVERRLLLRLEAKLRRRCAEAVVPGSSAQAARGRGSTERRPIKHKLSASDKRQDRPQQMLPRAATHRDRGNGHVRETLAQIAQKAGRRIEQFGEETGVARAGGIR